MLLQSVWGPVRYMCGVIPTAGHCVKPGSKPGCPWCDTKKLPPLLAVSSLFLLPKEVYMCLVADGSTCPHVWCLSLHSLSVPCLFFFSPFPLLCAFVSSPPFSPPFFLFICGSYPVFSLIIYFHLRFTFLTSCFLSVWHSCWLPNYLAFHKYTHQHTGTHVLPFLTAPHTYGGGGRDC